MHEWEPLIFCHVPCYSKWGFRVNDKGLRLRWSASLTQNPPLSGGSQAKVRVDLFCEPPVPLRELVEPIHNQIWIPWRGIITHLEYNIQPLYSPYEFAQFSHFQMRNAAKQCSPPFCSIHFTTNHYGFSKIKPILFWLIMPFLWSHLGRLFSTHSAP